MSLIRPKKFKLSSVNKLKFAVFIVNRPIENRVKKDILKYNGKILSAMPAVGISRASMFEVISGGTPSTVFFVAVRSEDAENLVESVSINNKFNQAGKGKGFLIDIDGHMGGKALFI